MKLQWAIFRHGYFICQAHHFNFPTTLKICVNFYRSDRLIVLSHDDCVWPTDIPLCSCTLHSDRCETALVSSFFLEYRCFRCESLVVVSILSCSSPSLCVGSIFWRIFSASRARAILDSRWLFKYLNKFIWFVSEFGQSVFNIFSNIMYSLIKSKMHEFCTQNVV